MIRRGVVLYFLDIRPPLVDGHYSSDVRCTCLTAANLVAVVEGGEVVDVGCPVCPLPAVAEVSRDPVRGRGCIGVFPPGAVVIG
jgi:hypothetical protein